MFIYSVRMSTLKFLGAVVLCLSVLVGVFLLSDDSKSAEAVETVSYEGIKTDEARRRFLEEYGWQLAGDAAKEGEITLPKNLDRVLIGYNEIQKAQGLDIGKYAGKTVMRYTYTVTNYEGYKDPVYANLFIYRGRVIGADICSASPDGFVHGLTKPEKG